VTSQSVRSCSLGEFWDLCKLTILSVVWSLVGGIWNNSLLQVSNNFNVGSKVFDSICH